MKHSIISAVLMVLTIAIGFVSCQKDPAITSNNITLYVEALEAQPEGETLRVNYSIEKPVDGLSLDVKCEAEWVKIDVVTASFFDITVDKNDSGEERSIALNLTYGSEVKSLTLSQKAWKAPISVKVDDVEATAVVFSVTTLDETTTWIGQFVD